MFNPLQASVATVLPGLVVMSRMYVILAQTGAQLLRLQTESVCYALAENARVFGTLAPAYLPGNGAATGRLFPGLLPEAARLTDMNHVYTDTLAQWSASLSSLVGESLETCLVAGRTFDEGISGTLPGRQATPGSQDRRVASVVIDFPDRRSEDMKRAMASNASRKRPTTKNTTGGR